MKSIVDTFKLKNGIEIPCVGFGTWQSEGDVASSAVECAIKAGYRHIDTAAAYHNQSSLAEGIKKSGIDRKDLFVTSKVWNTDRGYEKTMASFEKTMSDLGFDYLDLFLVHWPATPHHCENWEELNLSTWQALIDLYKAGRIRAIGVSNFRPYHLEALMKTEIQPMVNQIEFHPGVNQKETLEYCKENGIILEGWSPIGNGRLLENQNLKEIALKYGKSAAQICIKWVLQHDIIPLPKSSNPERIVQNTEIFDFEISTEDMMLIDNLQIPGETGLNPDEIDF